MPDRPPLPAQPVPLRGLGISVLALAVPVVVAFRVPGVAETDAGLLLWTSALIPAFVLTYYRGWRGATIAIAGGMATITLTHVGLLLTGAAEPDGGLLLSIVAAFLYVSLSIGYFRHLLDKARSEAEDAALTDGLTGLPNRRFATQVLASEFSRAVRGAPVAVVLFDLDHFKRFNDTWGHDTGDKVLATFAAALSTCTRQMDTSARYGGEEFLSVLADCTEEGAVTFAERVRARLAETPLEGLPSITVSCGVAAYQSGMEDWNALVKNADEALYAAKEGGRDRVVTAGRLDSVVDVVSDRDGRVLLIESDPRARRALSRILERAGHPVISVAEEDEAIDILSDPDQTLELVVLEFAAPTYGARTLAELERARPDLPLLYVSADGLADEPGALTGSRRTAHISKPVSSERMSSEVGALLGLAVER